MQILGSAILDITTFGSDEWMRYEPFRPEVIKFLRAEKNLTQKALSEQAGIPLDTIKKIESGAYKPSLETLEALGRFFNLFLYAEWKKEEGPGG